MDNLKIYNVVRNVPPEAKKSIGGGRLKGMTDINPMWRIKCLTEQFGVCGFGWYYKIINKHLEKCEDTNEVSAFVDIELFIKVDDEWSMPIQGTGGSMFVAKESKGLYVSDECFKMALTDALSVACKALGIGADVYFEKDKTKYSENNMEIQSKKISEAQIKRLFAIANTKGRDAETVKATLFKKYNVSNLSELTKKQYDEAVEGYENL